jgi:hypothetical protein
MTFAHGSTSELRQRTLKSKRANRLVTEARHSAVLIAFPGFKCQMTDVRCQTVSGAVLLLFGISSALALRTRLTSGV